MDGWLSLRIEREKVAQIDVIARPYGGRGPFMRQIVDRLLAQAGVAPGDNPIPKEGTPAGKRLPPLRLTEAELAVLRYRARERRMTPSTWAKTLIRLHLEIGAPVDDELRAELLNCRRQLQHIGRNVNQIAKAINRMALADGPAEIVEQLHAMNELRAAIGAAVEGIGAATKADLSYWEIPGERL
ncbi:MobC family plasmid mobilization relaxosome protein [Sphingopyxis indica]|uniref:plasmid mobilization relaxosome protein MobC n=1 Tax=Sphingopyxis indica TaxID=436663 RepID=UPI0029390D9D|nr:plasmid mobilization relaxosome protein MobC [Sphingopyxis indica]WOF43538.1 MobC family plasmid mobilization relaxosome protein [Sphingopyxis indica]